MPNLYTHLLIYTFFFAFQHLGSFGCFLGERKALINFKETLLDPSGKLASWNGHSCCSWEGVVCDHITGHVIKIGLRSTPGPKYDRLESKSLDASLLQLKHLSYLDLSGNDFNNANIPAFLGSLKELQYLNLSNTNFSGVVPHHLGNLSNLQTLDLNNKFAYKLVTNTLNWFSNLSTLEHLDLSAVNLGQTKHPFQILSKLPRLTMLSLSGSSLNNSHLPHTFANTTLLQHLRHLDLSSNSFRGEFPCFLRNMTSLEFLRLSYNKFNSSRANLPPSQNLVHLNLFSNMLNFEANWISTFVWNKCHLELIDVGNNQFHGEISGIFRNLSGCWIPSLVRLSLTGNNFSGSLPKEVSEMKQLKHLDVSLNSLSGSIPPSIGRLSVLETLDISYNMFSGTIPHSIGNLSMLRILNLNENPLRGDIPTSLGRLSVLRRLHISDTSLNATLTEAHMANLSELDSLWTSFSSIKFKVGYDWTPSFQLTFLEMMSSNIGSVFPPWLQSQKALTLLDLSNCNISGSLPKWIGGMNLQHLNLSNNFFWGAIPSLPNTILTLHLSNNIIDNPLPDSLCEMKALEVMDLSRNHLSGKLPDCWWKLKDLVSLSLSFNEISGIIPKSLMSICSLQWLQLNNNNLTGQLPIGSKECTPSILDVGQNKLSRNIPKWVGSSNVQILNMRDNEFNGVIPREICQASSLQIIDLSSNHLVGNIPNCFGNLSGMIEPRNFRFPTSGGAEYTQRMNLLLKGRDAEYNSILEYVVSMDLSNNNLSGEIPSELTRLACLIGLNLSHNHLQGEIPQKIEGLKILESLDVSNNNLFGRIPNGLSSLNFLSHLSLANNNLSGPIPKGHQLQTLDDPSFYDGNPLLCGEPLPKRCQNDEAPNGHNTENQSATHEDHIDKICLYAFVISGFAVGIWGFVGILLFKRRWRHAYFRFIEAIICKMWRRLSDK